ncbi:MAG: phasin family protein, partial [Stellaceae bacterium]
MSSKPKKPAAVAVQPQVAAESSKRVARVTETTLALAATSGYYDQLAALSHENFDAVIKANAALMEGFEAIANDAVDYARQTLATAGTATKEMLAAKTLDRVIEIQTGLAKNGLEALVE